MNKLYIFLALILSCFTSQAQVETVVSGLQGPWGLAVDGTNLYIAERNGGKVSVLDLTAPEDGTTDFVTGITNPSDLALGGGMLYIGEREGNDILVVDLSSPTPEVVTTASNYITGLELLGDDLYFCKSLGDTVYVADVSGGFPTSNVAFAGGLDEPYGIAIHGTDMYVADDAGKVKKIDMTASTPVAEDFKNYPQPNGVEIYGDLLYVADYDASAGAIYQINVVTDDVELLALSLSGPLAFAIYNDELYFSEFNGDRVSKLSLGVGIEENESDDKASIYPNPSSDKVYILGMEAGMDYVIYGLDGKEAASGTIDEDGMIDIQSLAAGSYNIQFNGSKSVRFVKE